jgi:FixJ family two-component response regulator
VRSRPEAARPAIFIVDDDDSLRQALVRQVGLLGYRVEGFATPEEVLRRAETVLADCILVDLVMPQMTGLELQRELAHRGHVMPAIFLTGRGDIPSAVEAMRNGAHDFLEKPVEVERLRAAIEGALAKSALQRDHDSNRAVLQQRFDSLTERQREVFRGVIAGAPNKVIAYRLGITVRTVKAHRHQVMEKLDMRSVADLAFAARDLGLEPKES